MEKLTRKQFIRRSAGLLAAAGTAPVLFSCGGRKMGSGKPNIIFILADDLGYGDLGCYGQKMIQTPSLDRMAAEGVRFTDFYAGSPVCGPSRCCLITGKHTGHARIRGNKNVPLKQEDLTLAEVLKSAGYRTVGIGKWDSGTEGTTGEPNRKGFDYWLGYLDRGQAHDYQPEFIWENGQKLTLGGQVYTHDLFTNRALEFLGENHSQPFFLYLSYTIPHANNELGWSTGNGMQVPDDRPYSDMPWPQIEKNYAAMVSRMDRDVGRILDLLPEKGIDERTIVFFSSDNGPHCEGGSSRTFFPEGRNVVDAHDPLFFDSNGPFRGIKRDLYEGGIRVPMIVRWPGVIRTASTSGRVWAFWDVLPTLAALAGAGAPPGLDGISMLPELLGREQSDHEYLYWEDYETGILRAVRLGKWKAVQLDPEWPVELYDLEQDPGEMNDISARNPDLVARIKRIMDQAHEEPDVSWFKRRRKA